MATVWACFNGGVNYSPGSPHNLRDIEQFDSVAAAGRALYARVNGREFGFDCVDRETASMHVWLAHPNDGEHEVTEYPDRQITIGSRGGTKIERV
jgi:hypothetical protein